MSANRNNHWITPRKDGWADVREGASRASGIYPTQQRAFETARESAKQEGGEVFIKGQNNLIRERNTYGKKDPSASKG